MARGIDLPTKLQEINHICRLDGTKTISLFKREFSIITTIGTHLIGQ